MSAIKTLSAKSWLVEIEDTLHPNSDPSFPRLIQSVVEWTGEQFHVRPWRVIQTIPLPDGSDRVVISGIPDTSYTWDVLVPTVAHAFTTSLVSSERRLWL